MQSIGAVRELVGQYDAVLCDVWGVLHDGRSVFPGAPEALLELRAAGMVVVLLTNMPRPSSTVPAALARLGFPDDAWDAIVTSGDAIRSELARRAPGPVLRLGRDADRALWEGLGLEFVEDLGSARFLAIAGLRDHAESPDAYATILRDARDRDLELLCANPDVQIMSGGSAAVVRWSRRRGLHRDRRAGRPGREAPRGDLRPCVRGRGRPCGSGHPTGADPRDR